MHSSKLLYFLFTEQWFSSNIVIIHAVFVHKANKIVDDRLTKMTCHYPSLYKRAIRNSEYASSSNLQHVFCAAVCNFMTISRFPLGWAWWSIQSLWWYASVIAYTKLSQRQCTVLDLIRFVGWHCVPDHRFDSCLMIIHIFKETAFSRISLYRDKISL